MRDNSAKLISSAMIVLAAAILVATGSLNRNWEVALFVMFTGGAIGLFGLGSWVRTMRES